MSLVPTSGGPVAVSKPIRDWLLLLAELVGKAPDDNGIRLMADMLAREFDPHVFTPDLLYAVGREFEYWPRLKPLAECITAYMAQNASPSVSIADQRLVGLDRNQLGLIAQHRRMVARGDEANSFRIFERHLARCEPLVLARLKEMGEAVTADEPPAHLPDRVERAVSATPSQIAGHFRGHGEVVRLRPQAPVRSPAEQVAELARQGVVVKEGVRDILVAPAVNRDSGNGRD